MDPSPSQLASIKTLDQLFEEAGVLTPLKEEVLKALGLPTTVREVAFVSDEDWQVLATSVVLPPEAGTQGPALALNPVQRSRIRFLQRVARLTAGLPVERETPPRGDSAAPPPPSKKVKLSSLVDPSAEAELVNLPSSEVRALFADYKVKRGAFPSKDHEPTEEQLSAVAQLLSAGQAPYVDLALFGPHGKRALRKLTLVAFTFQVESGTWRRTEIPGPPDFSTWWKAWQVLKTTLLLLKSVSTERLEQYGEHVRHLVETYGSEVWFLVYQAEDRFRSEEMDRMRRSAQIAYEALSKEAQASSDYQPEHPWEWIFGAAVGDAGREFWDTEVHKRAVFYLTKLKTRSETLEDGTTLSLSSEGSGRKNHDPAGNAGPGAPPPKKKKKQDKKAKSKEICLKFQRGTCSEPCPNGRRHVAADPGKQGSEKGKGKGKGVKSQ